MHVGGRVTRGGVVRPGGQERDHVVLDDRLHLGDRFRGGRRGGPDRVHRFGRHGPGFGGRLQDQRLDPGPQLVLVRIAPDPAHLGPCIALDHMLYPRASLTQTGPAPGLAVTDGRISPVTLVSAVCPGRLAVASAPPGERKRPGGARRRASRPARPAARSAGPRSPRWLPAPPWPARTGP